MSDDSKNWSSSRNILKEVPTVFADRLDVSKRKESRFWT